MARDATTTRRGFWSRYRESHYGVAGIIILGLIVAGAFAAGVFFPAGAQHLYDLSLGAPGSAGHALGTDQLGRDIASGLAYGARVSLSVGFMAAIISAFVGVVVGAVAGYFGGWTDIGLGKIVDAFLMIPAFFLILVVVALFGSSLYHEMIIIGLTIWPSNARLMRAQVLSLRERTFVNGERVVGKRDRAILLQHIIPNAIHPIVANTTLQMAGAILTEAGLSFVGLGDPNLVSWGQMIYNGRSVLTVAWWVSLFPGLAMVLTVLAFYFVGDGMGLALNPRLHDRKAA